jgi:hypothetical protein
MENLDVTHSRKWQAARMEKFASLLDRAVQNGAAYVALFGDLFGQERISETVIDQLFSVIKAEKQIQLLAFLSADSYNRITYRNDVPQNLHLICTQTADHYTDDHIALRMAKGTAEIQFGDNDSVYIRKASGRFVMTGLEETHTLPSFEPVGFEDSVEPVYGYSILEWSDETLGLYKVVQDQKYAFKAIDLKIQATDGENHILRKIDNAMKDVDVDTFLRITITGKSAFGLTLNGDAIKAKLQKKVFFVEVYDNTIMDIDEDAFEHGVLGLCQFVLDGAQLND